jgi:hypothetical protein
MTRFFDPLRYLLLCAKHSNRPLLAQREHIHIRVENVVQYSIDSKTGTVLVQHSTTWYVLYIQVKYEYQVVVRARYDVQYIITAMHLLQSIIRCSIQYSVFVRNHLMYGHTRTSNDVQSYGTALV